jgi:hypothetical protein
MVTTGRWPPVYDEDSLLATLREAISAATSHGDLYASREEGPGARAPIGLMLEGNRSLARSA